MTRPLFILFGDRRGLAAVEFALLLPLLCIGLLGLMDIGYRYYLWAQVDGIVQKAGRNSTLEARSPAEIDAEVRARVQALNKEARVDIERRAYSSFNNVRQPEYYRDTNGNSRYDPGECFEDENANGVWDADMGRTGSGGGARDVVQYSVKVDFKRLFPAALTFGGSNDDSMTVRTLLRNQPWEAQKVPSVVRCG